MANTFGPVAGPMNNPVQGPNLTPSEHALGLKAIYAACRTLYPDQPTPLQVTALRKYWMGGPDPLDFINMYANPGLSEHGSPPHWHYVTNGLSDLYGDSRLHSQCASLDDPSGFGFELTLRVRREPGDSKPPTWPAHLLQSIARYIFHSQAQLMVGDHIPWPSALDKQPFSSESPSQSRGELPDSSAKSIAVAAAATAASILAANRSSECRSDDDRLTSPETYASMVAAALAAVQFSKSAGPVELMSPHSPGSSCDSRIHHMLVVEDPQLKRISTPYGYVQFLQLVGLCNEELRLVQRWTGLHVQKLMASRAETGGALLVTDMRRKLTLFELEPRLTDIVNEQLRREGSNLSGVTTQYFVWGSITLSVLNDLIPGEMEARPQHYVDVSSPVPNLPSTSALQHTLQGATSTRDLETLHDRLVPFESTEMDVDEAVVTVSVKKDNDDDDFVDVVGDSASSSALTCGGSTQDKSKNDVTDTRLTGNVISAIHLQHTGSPSRLISDWCSESKKFAFARSDIREAESSHQSLGTCSSSQCLPESETPLACHTANRANSPELADGSFSSPSGRPGLHTLGSLGEGSAPCTPLAHLSLSPSTLDMFPTRTIDCLDVHLCREAAEMLPLAVGDRLRHGKHFTFLNSHFPDHAITLVPTGVSGAFVSEANPYVARGPWLQVLLPDDFLDRLECEFSVLTRPSEIKLPMVFRWPERRLRLCLLDVPESHIGPAGNVQQTNHGHVSSVFDKVGQCRPASISRNSQTSGFTGQRFTDRSPNSLSTSAFSYFPPGCVPPPTVLAAAFNASSSAFSQLSSETTSSAVPTNTQLVPPNMERPVTDNSMTNWLQFFTNIMHQRTASRVSDSNQAASVSDTYQAALSLLRQQPNPHYFISDINTQNTDRQ